MPTVSLERPPRPRGDVADGVLVREHLQGRDGAFEAIYRRYNERLVDWFDRRLNSRALAEDLAQDTMVRVLKYADSFDQDRPMWPWLKTAAYRVMINHLEATPEGDEPLQDQYHDEGELDPLLSSVERRPELERVMNLLSERYQVALSLRYVRGWSPDDVADFFGMTRNACNQLVFRARKAARREYERVCGEVRAIVAPVFGGAFAKMRALGARMRQTVEAIGLGSTTAAAEAFTQLAIGLALTAVGASGVLASTSAPTAAPEAVRSLDLTTFEGEGRTNSDAARPEVETAPVPPSRHHRTANPPGTRSGVDVEASSDGISAEVPASMNADAGAASDDRVAVSTRVLAYVPGFEEEDPIVSEVGVEIYCDPTSPVVYSTVCAGLDAVERIAPPPDG